MEKKFIVLFIAGWALLGGCREIFDPELDGVEGFLVVEGIITDAPERSEIRLGRSAPYGQGHYTRSRLEGAVVWVVDDHGETFRFSETEPGVYVPEPGFAGVAGRHYVLHLETPDGGSYVSASQEMMEPVITGAVSTETNTRNFQIPSQSGTPIPYEMEGVNVFIDLSGKDTPPMIRLESHLLVDYTVLLNSWYYFCWYRLSINDLIEREVARNLTPGNAQRHQIAFFPARPEDLPHIRFTGHYTFMLNVNITPNHYGSHRVIITDIYTLNEESYHFHTHRMRQLGNEGRFFDPVQSRLASNIRSMTDPGEVVLGFFEASPVIRKEIAVTRDGNNYVTHPVKLPADLVEQGCYIDVPLDFIVYE